MKLRDKKPALILIDIQKGFLDEKYCGGNRNNKEAERISGRILNRWRELNLPVFHIRHSSANPKSKLHESDSGFEFNDHVLPQNDEDIITKNVNSAFIGTELKEKLDVRKINTLVILGITTNHCVSTTARMAGNFGYETYVVSDATAAFDRMGVHGEKYDAELVHRMALANLHEEFASILTAEELLEKL